MSNKAETAQHTTLRVIQMVDTLNLGGAEVMAVNMSNLLFDNNIPVLLVATRQGGKAKNRLKEEIPCFIANKKSAHDVVAFVRLLKHIRRFKPTHIHAHSTSIIWAALLKLCMPGIRLIWHDHNGMREAIQEGFKNEKIRDFEKNVSKKVVRSFIFSDRLTRLLSGLFSSVIVVNDVLLKYAVKNLNVAGRNIWLLQNFAYPGNIPDYDFKYGALKNIIFVANLREQKAHDFFFSVVDKLLDNNPEWQILLVGKDFNDAWSKKLHSAHRNLQHKQRIIFLGEREDVFDLMRYSEIGLLTSKSEALPVTLIEYGLAGLPVLASDVGYCRAVLGSDDAVFPYGDGTALVERLNKLMQDDAWRRQEAKRIAAHIEENFSSSAIFKALLRVYLGSGVANNSEALSPKEQ